jgi:hypothetical protein
MRLLFNDFGVSLFVNTDVYFILYEHKSFF